MATFSDDVLVKFHMVVNGGDTLEQILNKNVSALERVTRRAMAARKAIKEVISPKAYGSYGDNEGIFGKIFKGDMRAINAAYKKALPEARKAVEDMLNQMRITPGKAQTAMSKGDKFQGLMDSFLFSESTFSKMDNFANNLAQLESRGMNISGAFRGVQEIFGEGSKELEQFNLSLGASRKSMADAKLQAEQMERLGPMFAFLFGGMQMQRMGLSILRFVLPSMEKLDNYTSQGTKSINAMNASFEFLKFTMFETVTSTAIFRNFVEWIIIGTNWLSEFVAKHPWVVAMAAAIGGFVTALGTLSIGAGIFNQFAMMASYLKVGGILSKGLAALKTTLTTGVVGKLFGAGLVAMAGLDLYNYATGSRAMSWGNIIMTSLKAGLGAAFLINPAAGVIASTVVLIGLTVTKLWTDSEVERQLEDIGRVARGYSERTGLFGKIFGIASADSAVGGFMRNIEQNLEPGSFMKGDIYSESGNTMSDLDLGISKQINEYNKLLKQQNEVNLKLQDTETILKNNPEYLMDLRTESAELASQLDKIYSLALAYGGEFKDSILTANARKSAEQEYLDLQSNKMYQQQEEARLAKESADAQALVVSEVAKSKEETDLFATNLNLLLDLFNGTNMQNGIMNLQKIDEIWMNASTHLNSFAKELDDWAAKVVTKTVQIKYVGGSSSSAGNTPSSTFNSKTYSSSITGGQNSSPAPGARTSPFTGGLY